MHFRRELDFDDLIETIDNLADEEIDEVVDWQMTDSPAAKTQKAGAPLGQNWQTRVATDLVGYRSQRSRMEVPPGLNRIAIPEPGALDFNFGNPLDPFQPIRVRNIEFEVQTMVDPVMDNLHIRLMFSRDAAQPRQYKQVAFPLEAIRSLRAPVVVLRENEIAPGRDIIVELAPELGADGLPRMRCFVEGP